MSREGPRNEPERNGWLEVLRELRNPRILVMLVYGFTAGLPYLLIFGTLSVWLREAGVERSMVTFFSWAALGYSFKYVWAPLVDKLPVPLLTRRLGRRRAWLLTSQTAVMLSMLWMAGTDPQRSLLATALSAVALGFSAATQDIVIDAYRIEAADRDLQAMMASTYVAGYRIGMLLGGAGALAIAGALGRAQGYDYRAWAIAYACMAGSMLLGIVTTIAIREPEVKVASATPRPTADYARFFLVFLVLAGVFVLGFLSTAELSDSLQARLVNQYGMVDRLAGFLVESSRLIASVALAAAVSFLLLKLRAAPAGLISETYVDPFRDFVRRFGKAALLLLLLIGTYRISDIVLGAVANVFYIDLGFTKEEIAAISKTFGLFMTLLGGFLGGLLSIRYGLIRTLFLGALLSAATNLLFAYLAVAGKSSLLLVIVIAADNLAGGMATAAFVAYLSSLTSLSFTATQYALFSSMMTLGPKLLAGYSGMMVDSVGYPMFFIGTAVLGAPVLVLVSLAGRVATEDRIGAAKSTVNG